MKRTARNRPSSRLMLVIVATILVLLFASAASGAEPTGTNNSRTAAAPDLAQPEGNGLQRLVEATGGRVNVRQNRATGVVGFLRITGDAGLSLTQSDSAQAETEAFFQQYGSIFGITAAATELVLLGTDTDSVGMQHLNYQQVYQGVPVFAAILRVHVNAENALTAANGVFVPHIAVNTVPALNSDAAAETALAAVVEKHSVDGVRVDAAGLSAVSNTLYVYRDGLIQGISGPNYLVYEVEVTNSTAVHDFVYVDAHTGKVVNHVSAVENALFRRLFEMNTSN